LISRLPLGLVTIARGKDWYDRSNEELCDIEETHAVGNDGSFAKRPRLLAEYSHSRQYEYLKPVLMFSHENHRVQGTNAVQDMSYQLFITIGRSNVPGACLSFGQVFILSMSRSIVPNLLAQQMPQIELQTPRVSQLLMSNTKSCA